jgi:uncharacterized protein
MEKADVNIMPVSEIIKILKQLKVEVKQKYRSEIKGVFGSYVRGDEKVGSDIDVLVEFEDGANLLDLVGLSLFLEEKLKCNVDVVPESSIRVEIKSKILREAIYL